MGQVPKDFILHHFSHVNLQQAFCCSHYPQSTCVLERTLQQLLLAGLLRRIALVYSEEDLKNKPLRTSNEGDMELDVGIWKVLMDWQHPGLHPQARFETVTKTWACPITFSTCSPPITSNISYPNMPNALIPF